MTFSLNFTIEIDSDRRLVKSKIYGIWKKETAEEYHREFVKMAKPLLKEKWAKLINLGNWKNSYPEINIIIGEHIRWCHQNNAVYSVYVVDNPVTKNQLKKMIAHSGLPNANKIFPTVAEAEIFLQQNGF
jgi:hypothetical protein